MSKIEGWLGLETGKLADFLWNLGAKIAIATIVLIIGFWLAKAASKATKKVLLKRDTDESLISFLTSLVGMLIKTLAVITAVTQMGVEMTSFAVILGAAGLAIGMAFSGTLSNFAGGVMILLFKPYKIGDLVSIQGETGTVSEILIFNTILKTPDNQTIIVANGAAANGNITNFTKDSPIRTVNWTFGIAYGDDLKVARELIHKFYDEDKRILADEERVVVLGELGDSSVNLACRVWVKNEDYFGVLFDMNERVYTEFGDAGLSIPFPQMDVHVQKD
ncbi:MAG: mechanosensitive ion channel [Crocinitomicaceae bacterium]|nr:mechanosensitive ion channel [Crocinitomicaceae bacterium]